MTSSPDLIHELRASRPVAPADLRARVREVAAGQPARSPVARWRFPLRRGLLVAVPAAAAIAIASAGVVGLSRSGAPSTEALRESVATGAANGQGAPQAAPKVAATTPSAADAATPDRAQQISATLTVEVADSDGVSRAAQDALDLTRSLGGYVVSSSVATGEEGSASITVRVPVAKVQDAITGLSGLGRIVSQQVNVADQQESIDAFERRMRSLRAQIALVNARLDSGQLDAETQARLQARLKNLRADLRGARRSIGVLRAESRTSTIQLTIVTPGVSGAVVPTSRIDRTIDGALNVLAWEGVVALGALIVLAPFALVAGAVWLGRRLYRRHEEERLLAT
jgi:hypothetical protein